MVNEIVRHSVTIKKDRENGEYYYVLRKGECQGETWDKSG